MTGPTIVLRLAELASRAHAHRRGLGSKGYRGKGRDEDMRWRDRLHALPVRSHGLFAPVPRGSPPADPDMPRGDQASCPIGGRLRATDARYRPLARGLDWNNACS